MFGARLRSQFRDLSPAPGFGVCLIGVLVMSKNVKQKTVYIDRTASGTRMTVYREKAWFEKYLPDCAKVLLGMILMLLILLALRFDSWH